jgi:hypothetical protein
MTVELIVIPAPTAPPPPWQLGWHCARDTIPGVSPLEIARAPAGTPIPAGARQISPGWRPSFTAHQLDLARADCRRERGTEFFDVAEVAAQGPRALARRLRELADDTLVNPLDLVEPLELAIGVPHPLAWCASIAVAERDAAVALHREAEDLWTVQASCGVIRAALPSGYDVWIGLGDQQHHVGVAPDYDAAEALLIRASQSRRVAIDIDVRRLLAAWSPSTPYASATLANYTRVLPLEIRRGPILGAGSLRLPPVAYWSDGVLTRCHLTLPWDDEEGRAEVKARRQAHERRARKRS